MAYSSDCRVIIIDTSPHPRTQTFKLTKSKIDFESNIVETESKIYLADAYCIKSSTSTIIISTSDVYRPFHLLLNKKACWMVIFTLIKVLIEAATAFNTHCHFKPPYKKQDDPLFHVHATLPGKNF